MGVAPRVAQFYVNILQYITEFTKNKGSGFFSISNFQGVSFAEYSTEQSSLDSYFSYFEHHLRRVLRAMNEDVREMFSSYRSDDITLSGLIIAFVIIFTTLMLRLNRRRRGG